MSALGTGDLIRRAWLERLRDVDWRLAVGPRSLVAPNRINGKATVGLCKKKHPDFSDALRKRGIEEVNEQAKETVAT